jgi:pSer/pThr/pTyr-binding forkhead associated (FHA) protein
VVDDAEPTIPAGPTVHVRLLSLDDPHTDGSADLNALLVAGTAPLVLGRSREADLHVNDHQVSARHCALALGPDERAVQVRDLGSTNGTFVDGESVEVASLAPGSTLRLGRSSWRVEIAPVTS